MKTTTTRVDRLQERVQQLHPYEVPEFVVLPVIAGNAAYLDWIKASTTVLEESQHEEAASEEHEEDDRRQAEVVFEPTANPWAE